MNNFIINNILESSTTTGTGNFTLAGAVSGYKDFLSVYRDSQYIFYRIWHTGANEWEEGSGYVSGTTLYRLQVRNSSNSNAAVNFSAGSKRVTACLLIEQSQSSSNTDGWLSSTDWNTFNNKQGSLTAAGFGSFINGLTGKTTPVDADEFVLSDSAASSVAKKVTGINFKAYLKTYFDTLYQAVLVSGTNIKTINSTSILGSGNISVSGYDPLTEQIYFQDFAYDYSFGSSSNFAVGTNGGSGQGGALLLTPTYTNALGVYRLTSGTSANTGLAYISNGSVAFNFKPSMFALTGIDRINLSALSDGTNRYVVRSGFMTQTYNSEPTAGVYFRYTDNVNSGNWQCVCRSASTETVINTTTAPTTTTNWDKLSIVINAAGTSVEFFINGTSQGSITTNIPTSTYLLKMIVLNKISGGSSQLLDIDCVYIKVTRTI